MLQEVIDYQRHEKRRGRKVHTATPLLDYQEDLLSGTKTEWTCLAGYKYFFVSAKGEFWLCSMNRVPGTHILDVTPDDLRAENRKKSCQPGCGVYCTVGESLFNNRPVSFLAGEVADRARAAFSRALGRHRTSDGEHPARSLHREHTNT